MMLEDFDGVVASDPQVVQISLCRGDQQMSDAGAMDLDTKEISLGMTHGEFEQVIAVAETDLDAARCLALEQPIEIDRSLRSTSRQLDTEPRPLLIECARLRVGDASGAQYEAADATPGCRGRIGGFGHGWHYDSDVKAGRTPVASVREHAPGTCVGITAVSKVSPMPTSAQTEIVRYRAGGRDLASYLAFDPTRTGPRPGLIVLPEWWGLNDYLRRRARELADLGFVAIATDVYGEGREAADSTEAGQLMGGLFQDKTALAERLTAAYEQLRAHPLVDPARIGAMGYCLGGALSLHMARLGLPLRGVASFHGALAKAHDAKKGEFKASVLICHGEADAMVSAEDQANFRQEMEALGVDYQFISYPGAKHGFTNPEATEKGKKYNLPLAYDEKTDRTSWEDMKAFWAKAFR